MKENNEDLETKEENEVIREALKDAKDAKERRLILNEVRMHRIISAYRKKTLKWNQVLRRSLLRRVIFFVTLAFLAAATGRVSVGFAVGFALGVFFSALLEVLGGKPFEDSSVSLDGPRGGELLLLFGLIAVSVLGLYAVGTYEFAFGIVAGFVLMLLLWVFFRPEEFEEF